MTETEALTGVYPNFANDATRLAWNCERDATLRALPTCLDVQLLLQITRRRIVLLKTLVAAPR